MNQNVLRQVKLIVYRLKKEYGLELIVWHPISADHNIETGKIAREYALMYIRRAILLPKTFSRDFEYDLTYIASGKNFVYGGFFDSAKRNVLIDVHDLPSNFELTNNDFIAFEGKRWELASLELAEHKEAWYIIAKEVASYDPVVPTYKIIGGESHRINCEYYQNGSFNDEPAYCSYNGNYWVWYDDTSVTWVISQIKGTLGTFYWTKGDGTVTGDYTPQGMATGTATVSII